jgi:Flp pilus assembly protein TadG
MNHRQLPIRLCQMIRRGRARQGQRDRDRGSAALWLAIVMVALLAMAGLVLDGGTALAARGQAADVAQAAARAGADALAPDAVFGGGGAASLTATESAADTAAQHVLAAAGLTGEVTVTAQSVTVTAHAIRHTAILSAIGIDEVHGSASATAFTLLGTTTAGG